VLNVVLNVTIEFYSVMMFNVCCTMSWWVKCEHSQRIWSVDYIAVVLFMLVYISVFFLYLFAVLRLFNDGIMRNVLVSSSFVNTVVFFPGSKMFCIREVFFFLQREGNSKVGPYAIIN